MGRGKEKRERRVVVKERRWRARQKIENGRVG